MKRTRLAPGLTPGLALCLALSAWLVLPDAAAQTEQPRPAGKSVKSAKPSSVVAKPTAPATRVLQITTNGDAVIDLPVQPGQLTHLVLPAGESFTLPPATGQGARCDDETHLWCIAAQGRDLFIKAKPGATSNNLIVVTERHRYAFDLRAVPRGALMRLSLMAPDSSAPGVRDSLAPRGTDDAVPQMLRVATPPPDPQQLLADRMSALPMPRNTQYSMAVGKSSEDITPSLVFDDGRFTYLRFAGNRPLPAIFQNGPDGGEETVNVRMGEDDLLVTDRVARRLVLRLGQAVVVVVNDAFDIEGQGPQDGTTVPGVSRTLTQVPKPPVRLPAALSAQQQRKPAVAPAPVVAAPVASAPVGPLVASAKANEAITPDKPMAPADVQPSSNALEAP